MGYLLTIAFSEPRKCGAYSIKNLANGFRQGLNQIDVLRIAKRLPEKELVRHLPGCCDRSKNREKNHRRYAQKSRKRSTGLTRRSFGKRPRGAFESVSCRPTSTIRSPVVILPTRLGIQVGQENELFHPESQSKRTFRRNSGQDENRSCCCGSTDHSCCGSPTGNSQPRCSNCRHD